ncbi:MAG: peptide/nickel transport system permease protein [Paraglaciecola psychrophila]
MSAFILRRLLQTVVVLILLSFVCYYVMSLMPGDPIDIMVSSNPKMTAEDVTRLKSLYGLDQPITVRYWHWLADFSQGNFGYSRTYRIPVQEMIAPRLVNTLYLSALVLTMALVIGIPLGVMAGLNPGSRFDYVANFFSYGGISLPSFWLGIMLIIVFAVKLEWLPAGGTQTIGANLSGWEAFVDRLKYLILPAISLMTLQAGVYLRFARSSMIEAMGNDFIRTARAKGLSRYRVIWVHGFRNALIPLITVVSLSASSIFSGAIITETVFAYQGVGKLVFDSIVGNDFNMAMVSFMISIAMVLTMNLLADILYALADPRISYN